MTSKRTSVSSALGALLLIAVSLLGVAAAQQGNEASLETLREAVANLEARLTQLEASATTNSLLLASRFLAEAQFHAMDDALNSGELDPRYLATVRETTAIIAAIHWPDELQETVRAFSSTARELAAALEEEDLEAAGDAAAAVHGAQHDLNNAILDVVTGQAVGNHGDESEGAPAGGGPGDGNHEQEQRADVPEGAVELSIELNEQGGAAGGAATHAFRSGDVIAFTVSSQVAGELHLHGYDLEWHLEEGEQQTRVIETASVGRFPLEFHPEDDSRGVVVGYVEVRP